ncbi:transposase family (plasmid) [Shigella boydii CDC 3083-94]|uniref:Transposase family n=1 Tax=Shigella boydii serotype 18 (strain CDC 3083-94 / BS512) TaxID=344609 RepID=B2TT80_SHIB3|nr:transposase family [Shigella boydii CDC 3083-94]
MTDFGGKTSIFSHPVYLFLRKFSLQDSRGGSDSLNVYCRNGQVEIDNNIGENALRSVAVGRKNYLFFGSDNGGESAAIIYSLLVTCKLNGVEPEDWLREVIVKLNDWPSNRVHELLPWNFSAVK